jgi:hypothetical protein
VHTYQKSRNHAVKYLGKEHPFSQKMETILTESSAKIKGVIERQNARLQNKYAPN